MLEEETNLNLDAALQSYQQVINEFDLARHSAALAIFRTAEVYRKMGRPEEARVYYARILREFPDQIDLTRLSHQHLFAPSPGAQRQLFMGREFAGGPGGLAQPFWLGDSPSSGFSTSRPPSRWLPEQPIPPSVFQQRVESLKSEIELLEQARKELEHKLKAGQATAADLRTIQREILQVQRDLDLWQGLAQTREEEEKGARTFDRVPSSGEETNPRAPTVFPDERLSAQTAKIGGLWTEFSEVNARFRRAQLRLNLARNPNLVHLPAELAQDPRYQRLKVEYEAAVLEGNKEVADTSRQRIRNWVERILLPELEAEMVLAHEHLQMITLEVAEEERKLNESREKASGSTSAGDAMLIIRNLRIIEGAKEQWAMENRKKLGDEPSIEELIVYMRGNEMPASIAGETYQINPFGQPSAVKLGGPIGRYSGGTVLSLQELERLFPRR
jgi:tetratricopeptide (TPR) repeat protein